MSAPEFPTQALRTAFEAMPGDLRPHLLHMRQLIYACAADDSALGPLSESLKWGQPSYVPKRPKTGSPIRLGVSKSGHAGLFTHCQTSLMHEFQQMAPPGLRFDGNRAVLFAADDALPVAALSTLIHRALRYHLKDAPAA